MTQQPSAMGAFRARLGSGKPAIGASITFSDPLVSDALAGSSDFLWIDTEHNAQSPEALNGHLLAARARGCAALVRVPASGAAFLKPVLDAGAEGIIVPQVRGVAEVREVVSDCRYPPQGRRGYGPRVPSNYGRIGTDPVVEQANREVFVAVMIETREALDEIDAIVKVPGLDSVVVGPWDLSGSLGMLGKVDHPTVVSAMERIISAARAAGIWVGAGMGADPVFGLTMIRRGVHWIQLGGDFSYLVLAMDQLTARVRKELL